MCDILVSKRVIYTGKENNAHTIYTINLTLQFK